MSAVWRALEIATPTGRLGQLALSKWVAIVRDDCKESSQLAYVLHFFQQWVVGLEKARIAKECLQSIILNEAVAISVLHRATTLTSVLS